MKDRVFEGRDVARALEAASLGLGLPVSGLRYMVLEEGSQATPAAAAAPARLVVFLDATERAAQTRPPASSAKVAGPVASSPRERLRRVVSAVADAAGEPLDATFDEGDETLTVRLRGPGEQLLLERGGEALRALEHLLQRAVSRDEPRRIRLTSERFRGQRDAYLQELARGLAEAVRADGVSRETDALNSYDRRIVHLAVQDEPGVRSFSVGEGGSRRVTLAPALPGPAHTPEVQ